MRTGEQLWNYGDWMMKAQLDAKRKQNRKSRKPASKDIFNVSVTTLGDDYKAYNLNSGRILFEAESYDEAMRVLRENYSVEG